MPSCNPIFSLYWLLPIGTSADHFVFCDDVNYIKKGYINRNRILVNNQPSFITIQLEGASQNKLINEIEILDNRHKILKTIENTYKKASFFDEVFPLLSHILQQNVTNIGELAANSITQVMQFLGITK